MPSFISQTTAAATSVTMPTHQAGDFLIICAYRNALTAPSLPAGYTSIATTSGNSNSIRVGYKIAASSSETSGTWTNASDIMVMVYRGLTGIGASAAASKASSTAPIIPGITCQALDTTSWAVGFFGSAQNGPPSGPATMTTRGSLNSTSGIWGGDTNAGVNSFTATVGSTSVIAGVSAGVTLELATSIPVNTLTDAFNQVTLNSTKWAEFLAGSATTTYASTGAQVNFPASSTASTDGDITSNSFVDLTGGALLLETVSMASAATSADCTITLKDFANSNALQFQYEAGGLFIQKVVSGAQTNLTNVTYSSTTHKWLRIRESGGTIFWDSSTDGLTWSNLFNVANPLSASIIQMMKVNISGICFQVETNPGTFKWRNLNVAPSTTLGKLYSPNMAVRRASFY